MNELLSERPSTSEMNGENQMGIGRDIKGSQVKYSAC